VTDFIVCAVTIIGWILALEVINQPHPVHATLALIGLALITAIQWGMVGFDFLALLLVLVYLGAVLVLFLFVVMTLNQQKVPALSLKVRMKRYFFPAILALLMSQTVFSNNTQIQNHISQNIQPQEIALALFSEYGVLIQGVGLFLLVAMIVCLLIIQNPLAKKSEV